MTKQKSKFGCNWTCCACVPNVSCEVFKIVGTSLLKMLLGELVSRTTPDSTWEFAMFYRASIAATVQNTLSLLSTIFETALLYYCSTMRKFCVDECYAVYLWQRNGYPGSKRDHWL
jgi:hypothetical protein